MGDLTGVLRLTSAEDLACWLRRSVTDWSDDGGELTEALDKAEDLDLRDGIGLVGTGGTDGDGVRRPAGLEDWAKLARLAALE
jgi:hypothetical protein